MYKALLIISLIEVIYIYINAPASNILKSPKLFKIVSYRSKKEINKN